MHRVVDMIRKLRSVLTTDLYGFPVTRISTSKLLFQSKLTVSYACGVDSCLLRGAPHDNCSSLWDRFLRVDMLRLEHVHVLLFVRSLLCPTFLLKALSTPPYYWS